MYVESGCEYGVSFVRKVQSGWRVSAVGALRARAKDG